MRWNCGETRLYIFDGYRCADNHPCVSLIIRLVVVYGPWAYTPLGTTRVKGVFFTLVSIRLGLCYLGKDSMIAGQLSVTTSPTRSPPAP